MSMRRRRRGEKGGNEEVFKCRPKKASRKQKPETRNQGERGSWLGLGSSWKGKGAIMVLPGSWLPFFTGTSSYTTQYTTVYSLSNGRIH